MICQQPEAVPYGLLMGVFGIGALAGALLAGTYGDHRRGKLLTINALDMQVMRSKYPGLRVYVASDWHAEMHKGCDIWMTDLSTVGYDLEKMRDLERLMRDAKITQIYEGTNQIQRIVIARELMRG